MTIGKKVIVSFSAVAGLFFVVGLIASITQGKGITLTAAFSGIAVAAALGFYVVSALKGQLGHLIHEISQGAEQVASAASQISSASQSLAQGTSQQAASLEETSASTEEINSMAKRNSENSHSAADLVKASEQRFTDTNRSLAQMVEAMSEINASSDKISKIIKVIDDIAFQTNILALNAAVEAARAGEAGMGFAVVADEVRNLAQRCAQAARDTAGLIEESIAKSNGGQEKVQQVAKAISAITDQSTQVRTLVDEVHLGSQEQSRGIDQIGKAMVQMEQMTQKAAASAEESASAAEELTAQSAALKDIVHRLTGALGLTSNSTGRSYVRSLTSAPAPARKVNIGTNLNALHKAVSPKRSSVKAASEPVGVGASKDAFPMDEDFKEF
jgi:methyl-accepting chemotaxis protein/methyl-accepting chemotaxis protein-1 (serine sensor receptor)